MRNGQAAKAATPSSGGTKGALPVVLLRPLAITLLIGLVVASTWLLLRPDGDGPLGRVADAAIGSGIGLEVDFDLVDHNGQPASLGDFQGTPLLVVFGYTSCPDVCPTVLSHLAELLDDLEREGVTATGAFITIDPARDTPEVLSDYVRAFHSRLHGLTGDEQSLKAATGSFRVFFEKVGEDSEDYLMNHSAYLYLLGPQGRVLSYYHPDLEPAALLADVRGRLGQ